MLGAEVHGLLTGTRSSDSIDWLVNSELVDCERVTLPLSSDGELANGSQSVWGMQEAKATFRDQLVIMRIKG